MQVLTRGVTHLVVSQVVSDGGVPVGSTSATDLVSSRTSLGEPQQRRLGQGAAVVSLDLPQAP